MILNVFALSTEMNLSPWFVYPAAYITVTFLSGSIVKLFVNRVENMHKPEPSKGLDPGTEIGKCENIITVTCILAGELTGLAIIFAAKSIVRNTDNSNYDNYYLCGTLVNLVWGLMVGYLAKALVA